LCWAQAYAQLKSTPRPAPLSAPPTNGTADSNGTASNSTDAPATKADTAKVLFYLLCRLLIIILAAALG
jgi:hypothetical protein